MKLIGVSIDLCKIIDYDSRNKEYIIECRCGRLLRRKTISNVDRLLKEGCKHCKYYLLNNADKFKAIKNYKDVVSLRYKTIDEAINLICPEGHEIAVKVKNLYNSTCSCKICKHHILNSDYVGKRFGRLVVLSQCYEGDKGKYTVDAICDCGNKITCRLQSLYFTKHSCGCLKSDTLKKIKKDTLAKATRTRNNSNKAYSSNISTGVKNISKLGNKYQLSVSRGKDRFVRYYDTLDDAISAKEYVLEKIKQNGGKLGGIF